MTPESPFPFIPVLIVVGAALAIAIYVLIILPKIKALAEAQEEKDGVFKGPVDKDRAVFLESVFGLSEDDLRAFHFDGEHFNLPKGAIPYTEVSSITCLSATPTVVHNADLPHDTTWRFARAGGGPDRRRSGNTPTFTSRKYVFALSGQVPSRLVTFDTRDLLEHAPSLASLAPSADRPNAGKSVLEKFQAFLGLAANQDIETKIIAYVAAVNTIAELDTELAQAEKRMREVDVVAAASLRLAGGAAPHGDLVNMTRNSTAEEQKQLSSTITRLNVALFDAKSSASQIIQEARDLLTVQAYNAR